MQLVSEYLRVLLESDKSLKIVSIVDTPEKLLETASDTPPDIALLCLMDDEGDQIEFISDLTEIAPSVKIVVLSSPNSNLDQPASLKLGVRGIVGANQNMRVLKRAIQQVFDGEVWLNQRLMDQLLNGASKNGHNGSNDLTNVEELTGREVEIIELVGVGMNNKAIASKLKISGATVRHHLSSIYGKLQLEDRLNLAIFAYKNGIVTPNGNGHSKAGAEGKSTNGA